MELYIHIDNLLIQTCSTDIRDQGALSRGERAPYKYSDCEQTYSDMSNEGIYHNWILGTEYRLFTDTLKKLERSKLAPGNKLFFVTYYPEKIAGRVLELFYPLLLPTIIALKPHDAVKYQTLFSSCESSTSLGEVDSPPGSETILFKAPQFVALHVLEFEDGLVDGFKQYLDHSCSDPKPDRILFTCDSYLLQNKTLTDCIIVKDAKEPHALKWALLSLRQQSLGDIESPV